MAPFLSLCERQHDLFPHVVESGLCAGSCWHRRMALVLFLETNFRYVLAYCL